tara:strand:+ start:2110 stop:2382 length:273 start_codon:yes stop_codon:yes gene_type:complete
MTDTHIHIHLNGEAASAVSAATSPDSPKKRKTVAKQTPTKKPRVVSAYHKTVGKEMSRLKRSKFRGNVMKAAHKAARKKHPIKKKGKGKK